MIPAAPLPANEAARLAALAAFEIIGSPPETEYDDLAGLAARICGCPIGYIALLDEDRQWTKASCGMARDQMTVPRSQSFCQYTLLSDDVVVIPDLSRDARFVQSPFVAGPPHVRFYAGMPLLTGDGLALGTICVLGFDAQDLDGDQKSGLRALARQVVANLELRRSGLELQRARDEIAREKARAETLLLNILPEPVADELKRANHVVPRAHEAVTLVFTDFVEFTRMAAQTSTHEVVETLNAFFTGFDEITSRHGLEKLKTSGDSYIFGGGLPAAAADHALDCCLAALEMVYYADIVNRQRGRDGKPAWRMRVGIHTGPVVSGVVGKRKFIYDVWGDTVNIAARMEQAGTADRINISCATRGLVHPFFQLEPRGPIAVKGRGELEMFFLDRLLPQHALDADGIFPGDSLKA